MNAATPCWRASTRRRRSLRSRVARSVGGPLQRHGGRRARGARRRRSNGCARRSCLAPDGAPPLGGPDAAERTWRLRPPWHFDCDAAARALSEQFHTRDLAGFGCADKPLAVAAAGALLAYVRETQKAALPHLRSLVTEERDGALDHGPCHAPQSRAGREPRRQAELTLAGVFDRTATAMGGRMLRRWLHRPLRDRHTLRERYQAVATLIDGSRIHAIAGCSRAIGDLERILARIALRSARPRDLVHLRAALGALPALHQTLRGVQARSPAPRRCSSSLLAAIGDHARSTPCSSAPWSIRRRISCATAA